MDVITLWRPGGNCDIDRSLRMLNCDIIFDGFARAQKRKEISLGWGCNFIIWRKTEVVSLQKNLSGSLWVSEGDWEWSEAQTDRVW